MISLSDAFEIARKELGPKISHRIWETEEYWIFGWDWDWESMGPIPPGSGGPVIVYKDTGKYEYPPIPPKRTPEMRQAFKTAKIIHFPDSKDK